MGLLCLGTTGCEDDSHSPATVATVTTNAVTGSVETNMVDGVNEAEAPAAEPAEGLGAPLPGNSVSGKWLGSYENAGHLALLSLTLVQDGEQVSGTYAFSDAGSGDIESGILKGETLALAVHRNGILCSIVGQVDFDAKTYVGTWADKAGNSGAFSLR